MVQIDIDYRGELRCEATHGPSATRLHTDAPVDNQGRGESFSPTDLLATALGTCMVTIMGIAAEGRGWSLEGLSARVTKHMVADPLRRVGRLEVSIRVPGEWSEEQRAVLRRAAETCPVAQSVSERLRVDLELAFG
jgi:putative redox protein